MKKDLDAIYSAEWFAHDFADLRPEFGLAADAIFRQFQGRLSSAVDVGCGPGMLIERLDYLGVNVKGIEGSSHGIEYASPNIRKLITHADILNIPALAGFDLVICTEVAEHLDAEDAPHLVRLLCSAVCPIIFTAAPRGQGGHEHVNEQSQEYWLELFSRHGVIPAWPETEQLKHRWRSLKRLSHMARNVMVLR